MRATEAAGNVPGAILSEVINEYSQEIAATYMAVLGTAVAVFKFL